MRKITSKEYRDLLYALILAIEVLEAEKNPRLKCIKELFETI